MADVVTDHLAARFAQSAKPRSRRMTYARAKRDARSLSCRIPPTSLSWVDRAEAIKSGGRTACPREPEALLRTHPAVDDACRVAIPSERLGERICACVVVTAGSIVTGDGWKELCREAAADYRVPDLVRCRNAASLPASAKVKRLEPRRSSARN